MELVNGGPVNYCIRRDRALSPSASLLPLPPSPLSCTHRRPLSFTLPPPTTAHLLSARRTAPFVFTGDAARPDTQLAMPVTQDRNPWDDTASCSFVSIILLLP
ncbi:uncharacterized protein N7511_000846 [Penicillium nucicola]|uniref:uncharacterized protein n=1 Tax=Penicillium nucicola TaxID=1850975 RepID=UPI0025459CD4|nr:uncharacterized protein N7511_000846 [Penicillium nucicola]KAJ5775835.1 hypothetical protein N7511_000846 [Penicillium nucicola]